MGPLMLDCQHLQLTQHEQELLAHPLVGGVILFSRNYADKAQLKALVQSIRQAAGRPILIAVDHEGGRVQRFRDGFTRLPAMGSLLAESGDIQQASELAKACGTIMAVELKSLDIDFSFAPVLDINGVSQVIGDRAFATDAAQVIELAGALIEGLQCGDMPAIGKHFPGHGSVAPDSHIALPVDERPMAEIDETDMCVFRALIRQQKLHGIMPAHVIYSAVDPNPAGFSCHWLQQVLRQQLQFDGAIFSDDLSMHGASVAGNYVSRAQAALAAGCDMVLACNNPAGAEQILDNLNYNGAASPALSRLSGRPLPSQAKKEYARASALLKSYVEEH